MKEFECISVKYYPEEELLFWRIKDTGMPNFCLRGLIEFNEFVVWAKDFFSKPENPLKFIVSGSEHQGIYNLGGDSPFFIKSIRTKDRERLRHYAHMCVEAIYNIYTSFGLSVITLALVEGNAYGGGFECALAHDFIVAESNVQLGVPENKFNLFPGMGAHSLLCRKASNSVAEMLIRSGQVYKAAYIQSLDLIEKVAYKERAVDVLYHYMGELRERFNFEYHHIQCKKMINPLFKNELLRITDVWVEASMKITDFDLRRMELLASAQSKLSKDLCPV